MTSRLLLLAILCVTALGAARAEAPLTGIDIYPVVPDGSVDAKTFSFKSLDTRKTVTVMSSVFPVISRRQVLTAELTVAEFIGAPADAVRLTFKPEAKARLLRAVKAKYSEVLILIRGEPLSTFEISELLEIIDHQGALLIFKPLPTREEGTQLNAALKQITAGTWNPNPEPAPTPTPTPP
ncbi:MAG: hypothetical protein NTY98_03040 [Verrucomicrobia bacterium]|nr:hypothetical protein [Verrucomicrobiota bacterium]